MTLHEALVALRENGPKNAAVGLCHHVSGAKYGGLYDLMEDWPEHSGNRHFPVGHPRMGASAAFAQVLNLWDRDTEYGRARWRLLDYLIERTKP